MGLAMRRDVEEKALEDGFRPIAVVVDRIMTEYMDVNNPMGIPKPQKVVPIPNRKRENPFPCDPSDLECDLNLDYVPVIVSKRILMSIQVYV